MRVDAHPGAADGLAALAALDSYRHAVKEKGERYRSRPRAVAVSADPARAAFTPTRNLDRVGLGTLVAAGGVGAVAVALAVALWLVTGDGGVGTILVAAVPPLGACAVVGFVCGRWWAFTGTAFLVTFFLLALAQGGDVEFGLLAFASLTAALAVGSTLRWVYEQRRLRNEEPHPPSSA